MPTLIVTLPATPADSAALFDYVLTPDGVSAAAHASVPAALLPAPGNAITEVVAVVPAQRLSWHTVQLPAGTLDQGLLAKLGAHNTHTPRLRTVLDGLLEDHLLDDPAQLHFALSPRPHTHAPVWVAACEHTWLRAALAALHASGHTPARIVPEFTPDTTPDTLCIVGEPEAAQLIRTSPAGVAVWPLDPASVALLNWPADAPVNAEPAVTALAEQLFDRPVTPQSRPQRLLQASQSDWNLAQFDLAHASRTRHLQRWQTAWSSVVRAPRWRAARWATLALVGANVLGLNALAWREKTQLTQQRAALKEVLTSTFPHVPVVVDAPLQMAREVAALQRASGSASGRDLEAMLTAFSAAAPDSPAPAAIEFIAGELRLKGLNLGADALAQVSFKLKPMGYTARSDGESLLIQHTEAP